MSKIQLIERSLLGINEAKFQDFCNQLFYCKGYNFVTSSGSVIGKEKTRKGTPDAYIPIGNNEYIFIEYTTKEKLGKSKSFFNKLSDDIDHCFNEEKSKIKNNQIRKVILCFVGKLNVGEHDELRRKCVEKNSEFEPYGIDDLKNAALYYPSLGGFLGVPIGTAQILSPPNFIKEYEKGKFSTTLSNKLYFRDKEIDYAISSLQNLNLLIIEGDSGVGKSRFALELLNKFCNENSSYNSICIDDKDAPIHEDLRNFLQKDVDYLLFIDDANRASKHYKAILNLLKEERDGSIKIIVTVRSYALGLIENLSSDFFYKKVKLKILTDNQIREILASDDFKITNTEYSDVIVRVALGNPRLAIMAAKVALKKQTLSAFNEIPKIYDSYYDGVTKEINELGDVTFLKVLGIISFFKTIGKGYRNSQDIYTVFDISKEEFWEKVIILEKMELVDFFDTEVVKISDQILGTYFFYKLFIRDGILDFFILIKNFYEIEQRRFRDTIYPIVNTFGFTIVKEKINKPLNEIWEHLIEDEPALLNFLSLFWIFQQDETLKYLGSKIINLSQEAIENYIFEKDKNDIAWRTDNKDYFGVLKAFLKHPTDNFSFALDLTFAYLEKRPSYLADFVHHVRTELTFGKNDYRNGFLVQVTLFDKLIASTHSEKYSELYKGIFYHIVNSFLLTIYEKSDGVNRDNSFTIYTFSLQDTPTIKGFREKIWHFISEDFTKNRKSVLKVIADYTNNRSSWFVTKTDYKHVQKFFSHDAKFIIPLIESSFNSESYLECKTVQDYFEKLKKLDIPFDENLKNRFINYKFELSLKLNSELIFGKKKYNLDDDKYKKKGGGRDWDALEKLKYQELKEYVKDYSYEDYKILWEDINELLEVEKGKLDTKFEGSFYKILCHLAEDKIDIFLSYLSHIIADKRLPIGFSGNYSYNLTLIALKSLGSRHAEFFIIINNIGNPYWKTSFFRCIKITYINRYYTEELFLHLNSIKGKHNFSHLKHFAKFQYSYNKMSIGCPSVLIEVVSALIKNKETQIIFDRNFMVAYHNRFNSNILLLKQVYYSNYKWDYHYDYRGKEMKTLCVLDSEFFIEFLKELYNPESTLVRREFPLHNFKFIWEFENYTEVVDKFMKFMKEDLPTYMDLEHFKSRFFIVNDKKEVDKKTGYIKSFIERNINDEKAINFIFDIISSSFLDNQLEFLKLFLQLNQNSDFFEGISFFQNGVYSGSRIPIIQSKIEVMNKIERLIDSMPNSILFIKHRIIVKNKIDYLEQDIKWEKKREFEDYHG